MRYKCTGCGELKDENEYYHHKRIDKENKKFVYRVPKCKVCYKKVSKSWRENNREKRVESYTNYNKKEVAKEKRRKYLRKRVKNGESKKWQRQNKDKISYYNRIRRHKNHDITKEQWIECKAFFSNSCAYCGMTYDEHKEKYNQDLHKEHVDHNGSNGIDNCVPSCRICNSSKHTFTLEEWYSPDNPKYDLSKLNKIRKWLEINKRR